GFLGAGKFVELRTERADTFEIRAGDVHLGAGLLAGVDELFEGKVGVRLEAAGGANGGDAACEIEGREAGTHFSIDGRRPRDGSRAGGRRIKHVIVHADEARDDGVAGEIERTRAWRNIHRGSGADFADGAVFDDKRLIVGGRGAGAVNDANVLES